MYLLKYIFEFIDNIFVKDKENNDIELNELNQKQI